MLGSSVFELALGLVFIFLLLSLVVSAVREAIEARLKTRSRHLARGIEQLLDSRDAAQKFYDHALVKCLHGGAKVPAAPFNGLTFAASLWEVMKSPFRELPTLPSYIPARTFALALLSLHDATPAVLPAPVQQALKTIRGAAGADVEQQLKGLADWYDTAMDRVAGWYKRETQHLLFWLGLLVAVALNVDAVFLAKYLNANDGARRALADNVQKVVDDTRLVAKVDQLRTLQRPAGAPPADTPEALRQEIDAADASVSAAVRRLTDLQLPIGWTRTRWNEFREWDSPQPWQTAAGWLLTAFAISFGAPFWFDLLNKIMVIRSTVKPHEKSPEEGSEDRKAVP